MQVFHHWLLTPQRAAIHLPTATAVVADLHLGYDEARRRGGDAIPAVALDDTLAGLKALFASTFVRRLVVAGDLCEDARCGDAVVELLAWLSREGIELAGVVPGNHDRGLEVPGEHFPLFPKGMRLGAWQVVHGDGAVPAGRVVQGHVHPCVRLGRGVAAPCFLVGRHRLILPAFSPDAAGVNVIGDRRWQGYRCCVVAGERVLDLGAAGQRKRSGPKRVR
jgi:putative SbcD/Mre11-related phosphoesterase